MASPFKSAVLPTDHSIESALAASATWPAADAARQPWRLRKHAHYQQAYKLSRKQQSSSMAYFASSRPSAVQWPVARVGLTVGKVLGNAVDRNRIKRRMREAVRANLHLLPAHVDVILHPRRSILALDFAMLKQEVERIFSGIASRMGARRDTPLSRP